MSDTTGRSGGSEPRQDRCRHGGGASQPERACLWCGYLDARGLWWLIALTCLPQLASRWSPARRSPGGPAGGPSTPAC